MRGQPSQGPDAPAIQTLVRGDRPVLLFCRALGRPYVLLGRLSLVAHDAATRPVRFLWQLLDAPALRAGPHADAFAALTATTGTSV
jgi:hypothetical protein